MAEIPHLKWPLRLTPAASGGLVFDVVEQDTIDDVAQCVHVLRSTPLGSRPLEPLVGSDDETFVGADPRLIAARLMDEDLGEPRADVTVEVVGAGPAQNVNVSVGLAGANGDERVTL